jgi:ATP-dependent DNA helicase RecQ
MKNISGVGERKYKQYGRKFLKVVYDFALEKSKQNKKITGGTYLLTFDLFRQGKKFEEIAKERGREVNTVVSHLAYLYENGYKIDIFQYVSLQEIEQVKEVSEKIAFADGIEPAKQIFEYLAGGLLMEKIIFALAHLKK